ncbi:hypothetical protein [Humibacillus xanthopallidus]|uniref:hypothetical protein n=1 Tax=Humibacillus xanthopallidus TaxID=412689 RepID=UPI0038501F77
MAYPRRKPADWDTWLSELQANLREPGPVKAAQQMTNSKASKASIKDAAVQLVHVRSAALVVIVNGGNDSDFPDPEAEAASIVDRLPAGLGPPPDDRGRRPLPPRGVPQEVAAAIIPFLREPTVPPAGLSCAGPSRPQT